MESLLADDSCQAQEELSESLGVTKQAIWKRLKAMGMIQKQENWVPYKLKQRNVKWRFFACEKLLQMQTWKGFLHPIVTGDEKCQKDGKKVVASHRQYSLQYSNH